MKSIFSTLIASLIFLCVSPVAFAAGTDCECAVIECGTCKEQVNIEFYTEKCGPGLKKVKSCKKPVCADKDPLPETCHAAAPAGDSKPADAPAKAEKPKVSQKAVGSVVTAVGEAAITRLAGDRLPAKVSLKIFEGDTIETEANGKVVIRMNNEHTINVVPSSKMVIQAHETTDATHKTLIN
ncbi:MAG: hypothetical protein ABL958_12825 [Bdellovibrionia bacterium]